MVLLAIESNDYYGLFSFCSCNPPKKSSTLNWPGRSFWSAGIFSTMGLDQGIAADYMNIHIYTHISYVWLCILYIYIWIDVLHGGKKKKKKRKSCHHLEISHDFPVVFWGSCTDWPVPPPVATSIITDFLKNSGERKTQKMSKKKVQISSKQPTLQSMSARTCSDFVWVTDLRDSRSTLSLSASKLYFLAMGFSRFFACAQTRTNPLVRTNKRFRFP